MPHAADAATSPRRSCPAPEGAPAGGVVLGLGLAGEQRVQLAIPSHDELRATGLQDQVRGHLRS
jgi:hypothetical protein